jgi:hypothetical protein
MCINPRDVVIWPDFQAAEPQPNWNFMTALIANGVACRTMPVNRIVMPGDWCPSLARRAIPWA